MIMRMAVFLVFPSGQHVLFIAKGASCDYPLED